MKFIAIAEDCLVAAGIGLLGLITNHAYLDNPTMRGLRHNILLSHRQAFFFDLGGSAKKAGDGADENVFDIQQGVAICLAVRGSQDAKQIYRHARLAGVRESKYRTLVSSTVADTQWFDLAPKPALYLFVPSDFGLQDEYQWFISLPDVFPLHSIGLFTSKDHFVISRDPATLLSNVRKFRDSRLDDEALCKSLEINTKDAWDVAKSRERLRQLKDSEVGRSIRGFVHRPFDTKYIFYHRSLVWSLAYPVNRNLLNGKNMALVTSRQLATLPWRHMFCADAIVEMFLISNKTKEGNHVFPLYISPEGSGVQADLALTQRRPNVDAEFLRRLSLALQVEQVGEHRLPKGFGATDIFHYAYGLFHSPTYRSRYAEFLRIDFPRIPLPSRLDLFREVARVGGELVALHLMESRRLDGFITSYSGPANPEVGRVGWSERTVWLDAAATKKGQPATPGTIGFRGVPEAVWNFHIGSYQVCEKWLKDRKGRTLSKDDLAHYQKIVVALAETIRLMREVDGVIDRHGGWPGAFQAKPAYAAGGGPPLRKVAEAQVRPVSRRRGP